MKARPPKVRPNRRRTRRLGNGKPVGAITAISATKVEAALDPVAEIAGIAGSTLQDAPQPLRLSGLPLFDWAAMPQVWLSELVRVEACGLASRDDDDFERARLALLKSFATRHASTLGTMGWRLLDVVGGLLDESCTFPWRGKRFELVDPLVDRLVLQIDDRRFTVRRERYRDANVLQRATRAADPPELPFDKALLRRGRGNGDLRTVMLALAYSSPVALDGLAKECSLPRERLIRGLRTLRDLGLVEPKQFTITREGWLRIVEDLPEHAEHANARMHRDYDDDIPF